MSAPLLTVRGVTKTFGALRALGPVDVDLMPGERLGLIGPNGSGKTTLINCITGLFFPEEGTITFNGEDITRLPAYLRARKGISRTFQIPRPFTGMSVLENLLVPLDYLGTRAKKARDRADEVLIQVGLDARRDNAVETLSQLELRKLELARVLVADPKVLIADEAMAGLSEAEIDDILALLFKLNEAGITIIMIEHIMQAVRGHRDVDTHRSALGEHGKEVAEDPKVQKVYFGEQTHR